MSFFTLKEVIDMVNREPSIDHHDRLDWFVVYLEVIDIGDLKIAKETHRDEDRGGPDGL